MYTDTVNEFFIKRRNGTKSFLRIAGIISMVMIMGFISLAVGFMVGELMAFALVLFIAFVVIGWVLIRREQVEYEYSFVTGDFDADKILYKTKRKPLLRIDAKSIEQMGIYHPGEINLKEYVNIFNVSSDEKGEGAIYLRVLSGNVKVTKKTKLGNGYVLILVENDERVKKAIKPYVRASVYREGMKDVG